MESSLISYQRAEKNWVQFEEINYFKVLMPNLKFESWLDSTTYLDHHWEISSHAELKSNSQLWNHHTNDCSLMSGFTNSNIFLLIFCVALSESKLATMIHVTAFKVNRILGWPTPLIQMPAPILIMYERHHNPILIMNCSWVQFCKRLF